MAFGFGHNPAKVARRSVMALAHDDWYAIGWPQSQRLEVELRRELTSRHRMCGQAWTAIARASASDDVLFLATDGQAAIVHLTWQKESSPNWPQAALFQDIGTAIEALRDWRDEPDAAELPPDIVCPQCGANWAADQSGPDCALCGGFALYRDCPVCNGQCGAVWRRAIQDSIDAGEPIILGQCNRSGAR